MESLGVALGAVPLAGVFGMARRALLSRFVTQNVITIPRTSMAMFKIDKIHATV
jgi:hypothetical protein